MSSVSIGITAMELFAYNPFRILGLPVNASHADIQRTYDKLNALADSGDLGNYKTPFDFDSLPPFSRSAQTIKTAHAKLASNGYRCFAYADSDFSVSLSIDDIMLNLRDISCYDCFLRCYMWLIINDRDLEYPDLWIQLAKYIDKLIMSSPEEWTKYFDNRFPEEMVDDSMLVYKSFYSTFCEIILLPLKEMVRGSMKCRSAIEILECAKIDVNEQFEEIDIPQANEPKPGEPKPKLKLALKYGDEYFDISTGTMRSYSEETSASESNSFSAAAAAPLDADVLINDEQPLTEQEIAAEQADKEFVEEVYHVQPPTSFRQPEPAPQQPAASSPAPFRSRAERRAERAEAAETAQPEKKAPPKPTELVAPKVEPLKMDDQEHEAPSIHGQTQVLGPSVPPKAPAAPTQPQPRPHRSLSSSRAQAAAGSAPQQPAQRSASFNSSANPFFTMNSGKKPVDEQQKPAAKVGVHSFEKVVEETVKQETANNDVDYNEDEEENMYTNALIEMLKSSSSRGETMKSVDTRHVVSAKEMAGPSHTTASMDSIDMRKYDAKNLSSAAGAERKMTREERYRNIKIDDMLGTNAQGKNYGMTAIDEYKKNKEKERANRRSLFLGIGFAALVLIVVVLFWLIGF